MSRPQSSVTMRPATVGDAKAIAHLSRDLIETGLGWSWTPERVTRAIQDRNTLTVIACERDRVVAFAIMFFGDEHAHLSLLAVQPSHQRQGLGRQMMAWMMDAISVAGVATVHLELRTSNYTARRFYRALGFTETAYIPGYYRGREMALRMVKALRDPAAPLPVWNPPKIH